MTRLIGEPRITGVLFRISGEMLMIRSCLRGLFVLALLAASLAPASADKLPGGIAGLVPQGYSLNPPRNMKAGIMGSVFFIARKRFDHRHSVQEGEYRFELNMTQLSAQLVAMQAPGYRAQLEADTQNKVPKAVPTGIVIRDPAVVKRYPWGTGITQRVTHKYVGAGSGPDEVEYICQYYGFMAAGDTTKSFEMHVSGVESVGEADGWAARAAAEIGKIAMRDVGG
jgi:hypothetical protein